MYLIYKEYAFLSLELFVLLLSQLSIESTKGRDDVEKIGGSIDRFTCDRKFPGVYGASKNAR